MRPDLSHLDQYRVAAMPSPPGATYGGFLIPSPIPGRMLCVVACDGRDTGWDHVSIHVARGNNQMATPTWLEMDWVKDAFFLPEETVAQFHVPPSAKINLHPHTLHLWRSLSTDFPLPPSILV